MSQRHQQRKTIACETIDLSMALAEPDLELLRRSFGELSDRLAGRLFAAGLDFDDVVIDRHILLGRAGQSMEVAAEFLSDVALFTRSLERQLDERGSPSGLDLWMMTGVRVEAWMLLPQR